MLFCGNLSLTTSIIITYDWSFSKPIIFLQLAKAEMLQKFKKKKKTPNGHAFGVDDPLDREATAGTNFSFGERNS